MRVLALASGIVILVIGLAIPSDQLSGSLIRLAGVLITGTALMLIARARIQSIEPPKFRGLRWAAWYLAGAGLLFVVIGLVASVVGQKRVALSLGFIGFNILIWGTISVALLGWLIAVIGTWRVIAMAGLLVILVLALPPLVVLASGGTPHYILGPQATGVADAAETVVLLLLVTAVIFGPLYISTWRSWDNASKDTRRLLPELMATLATSATIFYAVILHVSKGPLGNSSFTRVIIAGLITAVFLRPLYRWLAMTCWRWGPAEVFTVHHWRSNQMKMLRELYSAWRSYEFQKK